MRRSFLVDPTGRFAIDGDIVITKGNKGESIDDIVSAPQVTPSIMVVPPPTPTASLSDPSVTPSNVPTDISTDSDTTPPSSSQQTQQNDPAPENADSVLTAASEPANLEETQTTTPSSIESATTSTTIAMTPTITEVSPAPGLTNFLQEIRGAVEYLPPAHRAEVGVAFLGIGNLAIVGPIIPSDDEPPMTPFSMTLMAGEVDVGLGFWATGLALIIGSGISDGGLNGIF